MKPTETDDITVIDEEGRYSDRSFEDTVVEERHSGLDKSVQDFSQKSQPWKKALIVILIIVVIVGLFVFIFGNSIEEFFADLWERIADPNGGVVGPEGPF